MPARCPRDARAIMRSVIADASLKYAVVERERRWLLPEPPSGLDPTTARRIHDRYLRGTRLRLRAVTSYDGSITHKLGHKVVLDAAPPARIAHTSIYLDDAERGLLCALPADRLTKARYLLDLGDRVAALDVYDGDLLGLVTCEVDLGDGDDVVQDPPFATLAEVTGDPRFAGGALATTRRHELEALLAGHGIVAAPAG
jgi:CYTH domain-containing protein